MPWWVAIMRLPKPTMVVMPFSATPSTALRATSGPPWVRPSRWLRITLRPNSAAVPMISGRPQILARLNLMPKTCISPTVHSTPSTIGTSAERALAQTPDHEDAQAADEDEGVEAAR